MGKLKNTDRTWCFPVAFSIVQIDEISYVTMRTAN